MPKSYTATAVPPRIMAFCSTETVAAAALVPTQLKTSPGSGSAATSTGRITSCVVLLVGVILGRMQ